jgi:adenylylsulfate kinase
LVLQFYKNESNFYCIIFNIAKKHLIKNKSKNTNINENIIFKKSQGIDVENLFLNRNEKMLGQKTFVLWLTGLSGSGKSTVGTQIDLELHERGYLSYILDGDTLREGINRDLGFSTEDRIKNIERAANIVKILTEAGVIVIATFITPLQSLRDNIKTFFREGRYIEVFIKCSLEECIKRDPKGLYKKALNGEISDFTGISSTFEEPENPSVIVDTNKSSPKEATHLILKYLEENNLIT